MASELKPCPDKANCVSSLEAGRSSYIAPLPYSHDWQKAKSRLIELILALPRSELVSDEGGSFHVTVTSQFFGFVDDVEFVIDDVQKVIHVRSAARKGSYDFGVNRRRVEKLHNSFTSID